MNISVPPSMVRIDSQRYTSFYNRLQGAIASLISGLSAKTLTTNTLTAYTLVLADQGNLVVNSNAAAVTVTIPTNASVAFPVGTFVDILSTGAGGVTVAGAGGVTLNGTATVAQNARKRITQTAANVWNIS